MKVCSDAGSTAHFFMAFIEMATNTHTHTRTHIPSVDVDIHQEPVIHATGFFFS